MNRILVAVWVSLLVGCSSSRIISKPLPDNPISYVFKVRVQDASRRFIDSYRHHLPLRFFLPDYHFNGDGYDSIWPDWVKKILAVDSNKYDVCMELELDSSQIYFNKKGRPLEYSMDCVAHFTTVNDSVTKMQIWVLEARVHTRDALLPSPPHFVNNSIYKKVRPTTIEEYKLLLCFGKELGVMGKMPDLKTFSSGGPTDF